MPIVTKKSRSPVANQDLKNRLVDEWRGHGTRDPLPRTVQEEDDRGTVVHVYVVWSEWGELDQQARSELITEAYWEAFGEAGLALTVAMGLSPEEATRMGVATT